MKRGARGLAALIAYGVVAMGPAHAAPDRDGPWSVVAQCFEVTGGGGAIVWGYAIALGPALSTGITCTVEGVTVCSVAMPGAATACSGSRPSAAVGVPALVCGVGEATFTDGTTAETHTC